MARTRQAGFTLLEILVVLVILSMLLGLGVGAFSKVGGGPTIAADQIREVVRTARAHSQREGAPSAVLIDAERDRITGMGWRQVGCWHFEDAAEGGVSTGFPEDVFLGPARILPHGVIGNCMAMSLVPGQQPEVFIPAAPSLDSVDGIAAEVYIYLERAGAGQVLSKGTAYRLGINEDGLLEAALGLRQGTPGPDGAGGIRLAVLNSTDYLVPVRRWVKVGFQFNGYAFYLAAEGIERAREIFPKRCRLATHAGSAIDLGIPGPIGGGLQIRLDECRIAAAVIGDEIPFHESIDLLETAGTLHFDARGLLDRNFHTTPAAISFTHAGSEPHTMTLGLMGVWQ